MAKILVIESMCREYYGCKHYRSFDSKCWHPKIHGREVVEDEIPSWCPLETKEEDSE